MGNYKFRFSDMIPNAWFHKLKDMNKPRSSYTKTSNHTNTKHPPPQNHTSEFTKQQPHLSDQRKSYYFTRDLTSQTHSHKTNTPAEPPRKSSRRRGRRRRSTTRNRPHPAAATCTCRHDSPEETTNSGLDSPYQSSLSDPNSVLTEYGSDSPCECRAINDIIDDRDHRHLPPIITKKVEPPPPTKVRHRTSAEFTERNAYSSLSVKVVREDFLTEAESSASVRKFPAKSAASVGLKLRTNSPKIVNRRIQGRSSASRRSISESLAVVKASKDPGRDFKESMVEMIVENNIKASKDLEELLACYLSLNSDEYHDLIINVFKQIWFDFIHLRLK